MGLRIFCFFQPGCMGCMEQAPINKEVMKKTGVVIREIDAIRHPECVRKYSLKVTPTIILKGRHCP